MAYKLYFPSYLTNKKSNFILFKSKQRVSFRWRPSIANFKIFLEERHMVINQTSVKTSEACQQFNILFCFLPFKPKKKICY